MKDARHALDVRVRGQVPHERVAAKTDGQHDSGGQRRDLQRQRVNAGQEGEATAREPGGWGQKRDCGKITNAVTRRRSLASGEDQSDRDDSGLLMADDSRKRHPISETARCRHPQDSGGGLLGGGTEGGSRQA